MADEKRAGTCSIEGVAKNHKIIRELKRTSKTISCLAEDDKGQRVILTYLDTKRLLDQYRYIAHHEGRPIEEVDSVANERLAKTRDATREIANRIKGLVHPHVAETYGVGEDPAKGEIVVLSEYVPGVDFYYATHSLKPIAMISIFAMALEGLLFIHANGFLHLNIKPANIRVDLDQNPIVVKFTDFGLAVPTGDYEEKLIGTPVYMAPEVVLELRDKIDTRADLYSFAVLMYYCLTGNNPLDHRLEAGHDRVHLKTLVEREPLPSPPLHYNRDIPPALNDMIVGLLAKDPDARPYKTVTTLVEAFYKTWPEDSRKPPFEYTTTVWKEAKEPTVG